MQKTADSYESAVLANPVDYDTRDGCTLLGAVMGALHPMLTSYSLNIAAGE